MTHLKLAGLLLAMAAAAGWVSTAFAQGVYEWQPPATGNWNSNSNWVGPAGSFVPSSVFNETARIANGGTAQVLDTPDAVGGIAIDNGTLEVTASGNLTSEPGLDAGLPATTGEVTIAGAGTMSVTGTLNTPGIQSTGTIRTVGSGSSLNVTGGLNHNGTFVAELTSASHGAASVTGTATLGGAFVADVNGASIAPGGTWNIIDAGGFSGGFSSVAFTGASLPLGRVGFLQQVAGGSNGSLLQLGIEQRLVLNVDRETRIASILNTASSPGSFSIDGYTLQSALGSINPGGWNSLDNQNTAGGTWFETGAGGTANTLAELNPTTFSTLAPTASLTLGEVYDPNFVTFGQETEDYVFTYRTADGQSREGVVNYIGDKQYNNIVLTIDPATGGATMQNESELQISLDGYTIASESGSLLASYTSLEDQGAVDGAWLEANPTSNFLSEVMSECCTTLNEGQGFELGTLFDTGGQPDVTFQFLIAGTPTIFDGVVVYGELPDVDPPGPTLMGDFDKNGAVDGNDFLLWQANFGLTSGATQGQGDADGNGTVDGNDFLIWQANFGTVAGGGAAAVPEPGCLALLLACLGVMVLRRS